MKKIRINLGRIFPAWLRVTGSVILLSSIFLALSHLPEKVAIFTGILLSAFFPLLWSSFHILEINPVQREIAHIIWTGGMLRRRVSAFGELEKVEIRLTGKAATMKPAAYLITDHGEEHFLMSASSHDQLMEKLDPVVNRLSDLLSEKGDNASYKRIPIMSTSST